jgi:type IV pilus assembly protein PilZ
MSGGWAGSVSVPPGARRLHLVFDSPELFEQEYAQNLSKGGAFIPTQERFALREVVEIAVELPFAGDTLALAAEVVHCLLPEAVPAGGTAGVAVQFLDAAPALRRLLQPFLEMAEDQAAQLIAASEQRAVVDGEPSARQRELQELGEDLFANDMCGGGDSFDLAGSGAETVGEPVAEEAGGDAEADPNDKTHRNRAPRAPVRVAVRARGSSGQELVGRTRDMSRSGMLVSIDGEELPVGRDVTLELVHPASGESVPVAGRVVRHVRGEGAVAAVALQIEPDDTGRRAFESFLSEIADADEEQRKQGIRGPLDDLGPVGLLQMFCAIAPRGTLTVTSGAEEGMIAFESGALVMAQCRSVAGAKALARICQWRTGSFEFRGHVDPLPRPSDPVPMEEAILEALRMIDEQSRLTGPDLPPSLHFEVHRERLAELGTPLGALEESVLDLAAAGFTVRRILDVIPDADAEIRGAIHGLLELGLISGQS